MGSKSNGIQFKVEVGGNESTDKKKLKTLKTYSPIFPLKLAMTAK